MESWRSLSVVLQSMWSVVTGEFKYSVISLLCRFWKLKNVMNKEILTYYYKERLAQDEHISGSVKYGGSNIQLQISSGLFLFIMSCNLVYHGTDPNMLFF